MHADNCFHLRSSASICGFTIWLAAACAPPSRADALDDFRLPPKSAFPAPMPRYPNVWFYLDASLAPSYEAAVKRITGGLRQAMRLPEFYPPFSNPEGCDFEVRLEHLQPWEDPQHRPLQHAHAFHMRYYHTALERGNLHRVRLGERWFYRLAASAHYEVEHTNPNHADVETCPICGRTGEYAGLKGNLVELVHDPLGLELLMTGRIRGQLVRLEDWERRAVGDVDGLSKQFGVEKRVFAAQSGDRNTYRIGVVILRPKAGGAASR
jgi:hypothetical protein